MVEGLKLSCLVAGQVCMQPRHAAQLLAFSTAEMICEPATHPVTRAFHMDPSSHHQSYAGVEAGPADSSSTGVDLWSATVATGVHVVVSMLVAVPQPTWGASNCCSCCRTGISSRTLIYHTAATASDVKYLWVAAAAPCCRIQALVARSTLGS